jgi:formiminotetrahydrofolate cyclodeaminase
VVGYDGGADHISAYGGIDDANVGGLVEGAIFTRGPKDKKNTAIFIGGGNLSKGDSVLAVRLTEMMAEDIAAFDGLMAAYKLPKATEEDKARRSAAIESSLRRATEVPLACARACAAVIALTQRAADLGYKGVVSDAGVAVLAAFAALRSAALNVYINAPMLRDRIFADQSMAEIDRLVASAAADSETVYTTVRGRL